MRTALALVLLLTVPAAAAPSEDDRFALERTENGFVRLDRQTGQTSLCTLEQQSLRCRSSEDERSAMQAEIDRLAGEVDRLQSRLDQLDPNGTKTGRNDKGDILRLPDQKEVDRVFTFLGDAFQRLVRAVQDLLQSVNESGGR